MARRVHTYLDELEALEKVKDCKQKRRIIDGAGMDLVYFICDCVHNVLKRQYSCERQRKEKTQKTQRLFERVGKEEDFR